ncbi:MAG: DUF2268 domain-containing protein [Gemmatimonadaceae bacterium]|nr:DUF2268 domain-containing protein [Gemmatimonadaceae bacterium]
MPRGLTRLPSRPHLLLAVLSLVTITSALPGQPPCAVARVRERLAFPALTIVVVDQPDAVIPEVGLGGYTPSASQVRLFVDPRRSDFAAVVSRELLPLVAHEIHHAARWRAVGYGMTLRDAAVSEGLADHFAQEVSGAPAPPWSRALTDTALARWAAVVAAQSRGFYDHRAWFFGSGDSIPRWTGYAAGYELVRRHLRADTTRRASTLVGVPAAVIAPSP